SPVGLPRQGRAGELLGDLVRALPRGNAQHGGAARELAGPSVRRARDQRGRGRARRARLPRQDLASVPFAARPRHEDDGGVGSARSARELRARAGRAHPLQRLRRHRLDGTRGQVRDRASAAVSQRFAFLLSLLLASFSSAAEESLTVPFVTTPDEVVLRMLQLADTRPEDVVVDLGSGDGRIVIAAAQKFGARGVGVEIDAGLVAKSRENAARAGVAQRVSFVQGDVLAADISAASVVTVYLLPGLINRLQPKFLERLQPGTRIVSHAFTMTSWGPDRRETIRVSGPHPG